MINYHGVSYTSLYLHDSFLRGGTFFRGPVSLGKNINFDISHVRAWRALDVRAL